jgi:hypothetical protein
MNRIMIVTVMFLCSVVSANADTYTWKDDKGIVNYTDDPGLIPPRYREKAQKRDDITISNPKVRQEIQEQQERARREEINRTRIVPTPDYVPPPPPAVVESTKPATDELPPGRTKSQRIRDNIKRRAIEEKSLLPAGQK